jgi:hypothetical protein
MRRPTLLVAIAVLALLSIAASKYKAYVDFDRNADLAAIKTFAYFELLENSVAEAAPPVHELIKVLIVNRLKASGMKEVESDPDVYVSYHTNANQEMRINATLYQYNYSAGWAWSPLWGSGMDVSAYSRGTLVVDIWRPETDELIWRGTVVGIVPENPGVKEAERTIEKALDAIGKEWRKQRKQAR